MEVVDTTQINSFAPIAAQTDFPVSPSEEAVFIFTSGQLQDLIKEAIQPLRDRIGSLEARITAQDEKIRALEAREDHTEDNLGIQLRLIADLRKSQDPQPMQRDRGEILRALIAANGGKMLAKDARQKMHLKKNQFTRVIAATRDYIEIKPLHSDKRKMVLCLIGTRVLCTNSG